MNARNPDSWSRFTPRSERRIDAQLKRNFAPVDSRALGIAIGVTTALALALLTLASLSVDPGQRFPLSLLSHFLLGYTVSPVGVVVGAIWALAGGFCFGWLLGSLRNIGLSLWLMKVRIKADAESSQDILDHI